MLNFSTQPNFGAIKSHKNTTINHKYYISKWPEAAALFICWGPVWVWIEEYLRKKWFMFTLNIAQISVRFGLCHNGRWTSTTQESKEIWLFFTECQLHKSKNVQKSPVYQCKTILNQVINSGPHWLKLIDWHLIICEPWQPQHQWFSTTVLTLCTT